MSASLNVKTHALGNNILGYQGSASGITGCGICRRSANKRDDHARVLTGFKTRKPLAGMPPPHNPLRSIAALLTHTYCTVTAALGISKRSAAHGAIATAMTGPVFIASWPVFKLSPPSSPRPGPRPRHCTASFLSCSFSSLPSRFPGIQSRRTRPPLVYASAKFCHDIHRTAATDAVDDDVVRYLVKIS